MSRHKRKKWMPSIEPPYISIRLKLIESPAYQALSLSGRRALDRLMIEHMKHGGKRNGHLIVTYSNFEDFGITRRDTARALRELEALGLIEFTRRGRGGNSEFRISHMFRLTYMCTPIFEMDERGRVIETRLPEYREPTNEWAAIQTLEEAVTRLKAAHHPTRHRRRRKLAASVKTPAPPLSDKVVKFPVTPKPRPEPEPFPGTDMVPIDPAVFTELWGMEQQSAALKN